MRPVSWPLALNALGFVLAGVSGWQTGGGDLAWPFFVAALVAFLLAERVRRNAKGSADASERPNANP